ncbi:MAG: glycosyltransferase family 2 protein [Candidatus Omnitrophica bacterium]|nr:glycosyltransferase family 2 protein [Candidatus Omnitrophota bacterium]
MNAECLSIVMPVYNEKNTVLEIVNKVLKLESLKELIIVDDGSTDGTKELIQKTEFDPKVQKVFHEKNTGKGACLRTGFERAEGEIVGIQDSDLEYDPNEFSELIAPIQKGVADVVYGSRLWGGKPQRAHMFWHLVGNRFLTLVADVLYNTTLTDIETCYKVFRRDVLKEIRIESNGFSVEPELTAKILKKKLKVYEMPISYYGRTYEEGKKISWKHGFSALWTLIKYRFVD